MKKKTILAVLAKIGNYLLQFCKLMWEECLKEYLGNQIKALVTRGINLLRATRKTEEYQAKRDEVIDFVLNKIQLPVILRPVKWLIKKIIKDTVIKEVDEALEALEKRYI